MKATVRKQAKRDVILWLDMGWPRHRIDEQLFATYDATPEDTTLLIKEVRHLQQQGLDIERPEFLAQQMTRLEALAVKAQEEGQLGVALGAYKELHALAGLHGRGI
jgi:hypothetical protein